MNWNNISFMTLIGSFNKNKCHNIEHFVRFIDIKLLSFIKLPNAKLTKKLSLYIFVDEASVSFSSLFPYFLCDNKDFLTNGQQKQRTFFFLSPKIRQKYRGTVFPYFKSELCLKWHVGQDNFYVILARNAYKMKGRL